MLWTSGCPDVSSWVFRSIWILSLVHLLQDLQEWSLIGSVIENKKRWGPVRTSLALEINHCSSEVSAKFLRTSEFLTQARLVKIDYILYLLYIYIYSFPFICLKVDGTCIKVSCRASTLPWPIDFRDLSTLLIVHVLHLRDGFDQGLSLDLNIPGLRNLMPLETIDWMPCNAKCSVESSFWQRNPSLFSEYGGQLFGAQFLPVKIPFFASSILWILLVIYIIIIQ